MMIAHGTAILTFTVNAVETGHSLGFFYCHELTSIHNDGKRPHAKNLLLEQRISNTDGQSR